MLSVARRWREVGEVNAVELSLDQAFPLGAQEGQVVEAGVGGGRRSGIGFDVGMGGGDQAVGFGELQESALEPNLEAGEVEGIVAQFDGLAAQISGDLVAVALEREGGGFGDVAPGVVEEGLAELRRIDRPGAGGGVLAVAFERRLTDFGVEFAVVNDFDPGQEGLVELGQGGDRRAGQFGQEVGLDELEETFDLAPAFGGIGRAEDALDAEGGADGVEVLGGVDFALVDVDSQRAAIAGDGAFEAVFHARELFVPVELGVRDEAGVVVEEGKEESLALLVGIGWVGQPGAIHGVTLPEVAEVRALKATVGLGTLLSEELGCGGATLSQVAAQGAGRDAGFGDGVGLVQPEDVGDGAARAVGLLAFEGFGPIEGWGRDGPGLTSVAAGLGLEAVEAPRPVPAFPALKGGHADGAAGGIGDVIAPGGDLLSQAALAAGRVLAAQQRQDQCVAKEGDLGPAFFRVDGVGHQVTSWVKYCTQYSNQRSLAVEQNAVGRLGNQGGQRGLAGRS
jgi:hypothetical protein